MIAVTTTTVTVLGSAEGMSRASCCSACQPTDTGVKIRAGTHATTAIATWMPTLG